MSVRCRLCHTRLLLTSSASFEAQQHCAMTSGVSSTSTCTNDNEATRQGIRLAIAFTFASASCRRRSPTRSSYHLVPGSKCYSPSINHRQNRGWNFEALTYTKITTNRCSVDQGLCMCSLPQWCLLATIFNSLKFQQASLTRSHINVSSSSISTVFLGLASANDAS